MLEPQWQLSLNEIGGFALVSGFLAFVEPTEGIVHESHFNMGMKYVSIKGAESLSQK